VSAVCVATRAARLMLRPQPSRYRTLGTERPGPVPGLPDRTLNHSCADNLALEEVTVLDTLVQAGRGGKWAVTEVRDILRPATPVRHCGILIAPNCPSPSRRMQQNRSSKARQRALRSGWARSAQCSDRLGRSRGEVRSISDPLEAPAALWLPVTQTPRPFDTTFVL